MGRTPLTNGSNWSSNIQYSIRPSLFFLSFLAYYYWNYPGIWVLVIPFFIFSFYQTFLKSKKKKRKYHISRISIILQSFYTNMLAWFITKHLFEKLNYDHLGSWILWSNVRNKKNPLIHLNVSVNLINKIKANQV